MKIFQGCLAKALLLTSAVSSVTAQIPTSSNVVHSLQEDLPYDSEGKLSSHHLFYPADFPDCPAAFNKIPTGFQFRPLGGEALAEVFPDYEGVGHGCPVACQAVGTDKTLVQHVMPHMRNDDSSLNFNEWFEEKCKKVEVCLLNYHSRDAPLKLYWVDEATGNRKLHMEIEWGEQKTRCFHSFVGHTFQAVDGTTNKLVEEFTVEYILSRAIGESPPSGTSQGHNFEAEISNTLRHEWTKHKRIQRTFSPLGFQKAKLPRDLFAQMSSFYYNNRNNAVREEWDGKGVFVNWWEADPYFIQVPWATKGVWHYRLQELVEEWSGVKVVQTDMYGLRQYVEGSRLLTHVDRETTHAVSLITNVAQSNLSEPWAIEVNDHADRLHEVIMHPGDIVFYESAKALHGRNRPLSGTDAKYINIFTHYRPINEETGEGDPRWMEKSNPPGTPEPILEMKGECRLQAVGTSELPNGQFGVVEGVKCDDKRLEATMSPTLFQATSGEDLMDWWRMTGGQQQQQDKKES